MPKRVAVANWISLHRRLVLPCFPEQEAGPAAIYGSFPSWLSTVASRVRSLETGNKDIVGLGAREGVTQSVVILSPMIPGIVELAACVDWRLWDGRLFPKIDADVFIVLRPLDILPRMKLREAPQYLLNAAFGGGAVYSVTDTWAMIDSHKKAQQRSRRSC